VRLQPLPICTTLHQKLTQDTPVSVESKLSSVEPGCRWAPVVHPPVKPLVRVSYQGTMKTSVRMLKTSGGL